MQMRFGWISKYRGRSESRLPSLQVGRVLAAISVLLFHLSIAFSDNRFGGKNLFSEWTRLGYLGVNFFFVLSGAIIVFAHRSDWGRPTEVSRYFWNRFVRIFPVYWIILAITFTGTTLTHGIKAFPVHFYDWLSILSLIRWTNFAEPIGAAWTLYYEIAFYLMFSTFLINRTLGFLVATVWLLAVATSGLTFDSKFQSIEQLLAPYNFLFLFGGIAAYFSYRIVSPHAFILIGISVILLIAIMALAPVDDGALWSNLLLGIGFAGLIAGLMAADLQRRFRWPSTMLLLGDASFSIYLLHASVIAIFLKIAHRFALLDAPYREGAYGVIAIATLIVSTLFYLVIERPLVKWLKSLIAFRKRNKGT